MLVIDPEECVDCRLCVSECPVNAIYPGDEAPDDQQVCFEINKKFSQRLPVSLAGDLLLTSTSDRRPGPKTIFLIRKARIEHETG